LIAAVCGAALAVSLFLDWYSTDHSNRFSRIDGKPFQTVSAWQAERIVSILLLLASAAPLILLWIILREHKLSWPRGEMTAVVAIIAFVLILVLGLVVRPGEPRDTISLKLGWFIAVAAAIGMIVGAALRSTRSANPRKPPGTL
jgi:di/tricarboxylate transporter